MKKRLIGTLLLGALTFASTSVFVSCSDYDDDISNLQAQIDQLSKNLAQIETAITAGSTITSVEKLTDGTGGIKITLSDGSSYEISNGAKGEKGDKGDQGEQGIQGEKGDKGDTGATGAQGEKGDKGDKGDTGATGAAGKDAVVWTIGDDGYWYQDGVKTEYRAIGEKGDTGAQGPQGEKGDKGDTGATGAQGPQGDQGVQGPQGPQGEKGDKGDTGATGATGAQGPQGEKGDKGDTGATGATGAQGPQGEKGDTGAQGPQGEKGDTGATGPQGPQGEKGEQGEQGIQGEKGEKGDTGATGPQGPQGEKGDTGAAGKDGGYYKPDPETGCWIYVDGVTGEETLTDESYMAKDPNALTATIVDGKLAIQNLLMEDGTYGTYYLAMSNAVRSLVFAGDLKESEDAEIERCYVDGVPAIRVKSVTYKALTLTKKDTKDEVATKATRETPITPDVYAYYHVNPANANIDDLKTNLEYVVKADAKYISTTRGKSEGFDAKVAFEAFEDGILTVKVTIEGKPATEDYISTIALQTETSDGVVTSDYTTVYAAEYKDVRIAKTEEDDYHYRRAEKGISVNDNEAGIEAAAWTVPYNNEEAGADFTINVNAEDEANKVLDLNKAVEVHVLANGAVKCTTESIALFGDVTYELVNYDNALEYAEIVDGVLQVKEGKELIAKNRTPIVRVTLKDGNNVVQIAYIKVKIVAKAELTLTMPEYDYQCGIARQTKKNTAAQINTDVYDKLGLTAGEFNERYTTLESLEENGIGTVVLLADGNIEWTLTEEELWDNAGNEITHKVKITGEDDEVIITLKATVKKVVKASDVKTAQYWNEFWADGYDHTNFNCQVPQSETDSDPDHCVYINDLNAPFKTADGLLELLDETGNTIDAVKDIKYTFHENNNRTYAGHDITVSEDGLELKVGNEVIATIKNQQDGTNKVGQLFVGGFNYIEYNKNSDIAKELLNTNAFQVYIQAVGIVCEENKKEVKVTFNGEDYYTAQYIQPIQIGEVPTDVYFKDGVDYGEEFSYLDIITVINPMDWRNREFNSTNKRTNYWDFYGEFNIKVTDDDLKAAEMKLNGDWVTVPATVELKFIAPGDDEYPTFQAKLNAPYGVITYRNSGLELKYESAVKVKVTVEYGWGILKREVTIPVKKTITGDDFQSRKK